MKRGKLMVLVSIFIFLLSCVADIPDEEDSKAVISKKTGTRTTCSDAGVGSDGSANYGAHFANWLNNNGYSDLASTEGWGGSHSGDCLAYYQPVIFIHGNGSYAQGWSDARSSFIDTYNYYPSELYAIGWGLKGLGNVSENHHKAEHMQKIRRFIDAVKAYTGKSKVDVIGHSMGATLARKAILGGNAYNTYDRSGDPVALGSNKASIIDTFVSSAGANRGMNSCGWWDGGTAVWSKSCWSNGLSIDNPFLDDVNNKTIQGESGGYYPVSIASYKFAIISWGDTTICNGSCYVWSNHTSAIPKCDNGYYPGYSYSTLDHLDLRDHSWAHEDMYNFVMNHNGTNFTGCGQD